MSRLVSTALDFISINDQEFLDAYYKYSIPTNDNIELKNCLVSTFIFDGKNIQYKSFNFFVNLTKQELNSLEGDFAYISIEFNREKISDIIEILEKKYFI